MAKTKSNSRTRRNQKRAAARLATASGLFQAVNPVSAFESGDPHKAFDAVEALKKARTMPAQVQRDNAKAKLVLAIGGQLTDKADAELKQAAIEAEQFQSDLAGAYIDAIEGRKDDTMSGKDLAVLCNLMGNGMTNAVKAAIMAS